LDWIYLAHASNVLSFVFTSPQVCIPPGQIPYERTEYRKIDNASRTRVAKSTCLLRWQKPKSR